MEPEGGYRHEFTELRLNHDPPAAANLALTLYNIKPLDITAVSHP